MHFEGDWEELNQRSSEALASFLNANGFSVGADFAARLLEHRQLGWRLTEETNTEHTMEQALGEVLVEAGHASVNGMLARAAGVYYARGETHWHSYPDAVATLQELERRHIRAALISNADDDAMVHREVELLGFAPYLTPVLSSAAEPRWRKPDPRIFHLVSDAWQMPPGEIAMVGDAPRYDILGAHRAGMRGILIERGDNAAWQQVPPELANDPALAADVTVHSLAEIPAAIERL
jgi:putative hydrolase of the HAD superfamily